MYWCVKLRARCIHERLGCSECRLTQFRAPARREETAAQPDDTRSHSRALPLNWTLSDSVRFLSSRTRQIQNSNTEFLFVNATRSETIVLWHNATCVIPLPAFVDWLTSIVLTKFPWRYSLLSLWTCLFDLLTVITGSLFCVLWKADKIIY